MFKVFKRKNFLYFLYIILTVWVLVEISSRWIFPGIMENDSYQSLLLEKVAGTPFFFINEHLVRDPKYGVMLAPDYKENISRAEYNFSFQTNSMGFRSPLAFGNFSNIKVMLLGDSMMFGWGLKETETIGANLQKKNQDSSLKVFNYAVPGTNTIHALNIGRNFSDSLNPSHIILSIFTGNDILPNYYSQVNDQGQFSISEPLVNQLKQLIKNEMSPAWWSYFGRVVHYRILHLRMRYKLSQMTQVLQKTLKQLLIFQENCQSKGRKFHVLLIPPRQYDANSWVFGSSFLEELHQSISDSCIAQGISILDLKEAFSEAGNKGDYYFPEDGHLNERGSKKAAELISNAWFGSELGH